MTIECLKSDREEIKEKMALLQQKANRLDSLIAAKEIANGTQMSILDEINSINFKQL